MFRKAKLNSAVLSVITASLAAGTAPMAVAQLEEVLVTATKRTASTQDIPVTVSAITSDKLDQLGITNFDDYIVQLPGATSLRLPAASSTRSVRSCSAGPRRARRGRPKRPS